MIDQQEGLLEERLVAVIDILGYTQMTQESNSSIDMQRKILLAQELFKRERGFLDKYRNLDKEISSGSDTIVFSYRKSRSALFCLLMDIIHFQFRMLAEGFLVRGGISMGKMKHDDSDSVFVGPGYIQASCLEKKADFPRVIIEEETIRRLFEEWPSLHSPEEEMNYINRLIAQDVDDGYFYVDFLRANSEFDFYAAYLLFLERSKYLIEENLNDYKLIRNPRAKSKWEWFRRYHNCVVMEIAPRNEEVFYKWLSAED